MEDDTRRVLVEMLDSVASGTDELLDSEKYAEIRTALDQMYRGDTCEISSEEDTDDSDDDMFREMIAKETLEESRERHDTAGEKGEELPELEKLSIDLPPEAVLRAVGSVLYIVEQLLVVSGEGAGDTLDSDTVVFREAVELDKDTLQLGSAELSHGEYADDLFLIASSIKKLQEGLKGLMKDRRVLGRIHETIGTVKKPHYTVRLDEDDSLAVGAQVFYVPTDAALTKQVFVERLRAEQPRATDGENEDENQFSDDEEERAAKRDIRQAKTAAKTDPTEAGVTSAFGCKRSWRPPQAPRHQAPQAPRYQAPQAPRHQPPGPEHFTPLSGFEHFPLVSNGQYFGPRPPGPPLRPWGMLPPRGFPAGPPPQFGAPPMFYGRPPPGGFRPPPHAMGSNWPPEGHRPRFGVAQHQSCPFGPSASDVIADSLQSAYPIDSRHIQKKG